MPEVSSGLPLAPLMWVNVHVTLGHLTAGQSAKQALRLCVLKETSLGQLRHLVALKLTQQTAGASGLEALPGHSAALTQGGSPTHARSPGARFAPPSRRPATAPAAAAGSVATSLATAAAEEKSVGRPPEALTLRLIFDGRLLGDEAEGQPLAELGLSDGAVVHCLAAPKVDTEQRIACYPHKCSTDGGRVVHVVGEQFPFSTRLACRFGAVMVGAEVETREGSVTDAASVVLRCVAPPHPAGPVTLSVSFDGGVTWLGGPTFWYVDPSFAACPFGVAVPASCAGMAQGVRVDALFGQSWRIDRGGGPDNYPGGDCA